MNNLIMDYPSKIPTDRIVLFLRIPGDPLSKPRPRLSLHGHAYTPNPARIAEATIQAYIRQQCPGLQADASTLFGLRCFFYKKNGQRRDVDNMIKLVSDACNKLIWEDDAQVEEVFGRRFMDRTDPRTDLLIYKLDGSTTPIIPCLSCGTPFPLYPSQDGSADQNVRRYCSKVCSNQAAITSKEVQCSYCAKTFLRRLSHINRNAAKVFCSLACRHAATQDRTEYVCCVCKKVFHRAIPRGREGDNTFCSLRCMQTFFDGKLVKHGYGTCQTCNRATSKPEYDRCRSCMLKARMSTHKKFGASY